MNVTVLVAAALTLAASSVCEAQITPTTETVLRRHSEATGGRDQIVRHHTLHREASLDIAAFGIKGTLLLDREAPDKFRSVRTLPGMGQSEQGFDGQVAWERGGAVDGVKVLSGADAAALQRQASFVADLRLERGDPVLSAPVRVTWEGRDCWQLEIVLANGSHAQDFYDVGTGLWYGTADEVESVAGKLGRRTIVLEYGSYEGVRLPAVVKQILPQFETLITYTATAWDAVVSPPIRRPESGR